MHPPRPQLHSLTGIRFFAALYVFVFHFGAGFAQARNAPTLVVNFLTNGFFGVSIFFVLSGFILSYTYQAGVGSLRDYAFARLARIYPVYLLALLVTLPVAKEAFGPGGALAVLTMVQSWTSFKSEFGYTWLMQAWTLSIELAFYLSFPALIYVLAKASKLQVVALLIATAAIVVGLGIPVMAPGTPTSLFMPWTSHVPLPLLRATEFVLGILVCRLWLQRGQMSNPERSGDLVVGVLLAGIVAALALSVDVHALGLATVLFAALIYFCAGSTGYFARFMGSAPLQLLGGASYAMYLLQNPVREWIRVLVPSPSMQQWINPIVLIGLSILVFLFYEKPARQAVLRFSRRNARGIPATAR